MQAGSVSASGHNLMCLFMLVAFLSYVFFVGRSLTSKLTSRRQTHSFFSEFLVLCLLVCWYFLILCFLLRWYFIGVCCPVFVGASTLSCAASVAVFISLIFTLWSQIANFYPVLSVTNCSSNMVELLVRHHLVVITVVSQSLSLTCMLPRPLVLITISNKCFSRAALTY